MAELICPRCRCSHYELVVPGLVLPDPADFCPGCRDLVPRHPVTACEVLSEAFRCFMRAVYAPEESGGAANCNLCAQASVHPVQIVAQFRELQCRACGLAELVRCNDGVVLHSRIRRDPGQDQPPE